jgi:hypothetical protein
MHLHMLVGVSLMLPVLHVKQINLHTIDRNGRMLNFFIFNLSWFSKNNWSNQNFRQMYIWRRGPRRLEFLPPWATALGDTPTVGGPGRWGHAPDDVANGGRIPGAVAHDGRRLPTTAGGGLYKGSSPCRRPSLLPPSTLHIFCFQPLRSTSEVYF